MASPIRTRPSFPLSQSLPSGSFHKPLILLHQRAETLLGNEYKDPQQYPMLVHAIFNPILLIGRAVFPPLFDLRPNYGGDNEDNGNFLQKVPCTHCCTQCPQPCSRPPPTHASTRDSWTLTGKSGSLSCGVTAPFSWVLVCTKFCLCPPRVCFPVLCKFCNLIHWPPKSNSLGILSPCVRSPG